jgi:hypothetical protein
MGDASSPIPAGAGRPPVTDPDARVRVEAVRRLFAYSAPAHLLAIPAAFFIAAMFGQVTATGIVWGWAIALATVECVRLGLYLVFRAAGDHVADSLRWQRLFFAGMLISALTWGAAGIIFFHPELPLMQLLLAAMLGIRRESVTLSANELRQAGAIEYRRAAVSIVDRQTLERQSCSCYPAVTEGYVRLLTNELPDSTQGGS